MLKDRYLTKYILEDLLDKMVFVGGARQVGKTTLAKKIIASSSLLQGKAQHSILLPGSKKVRCGPAYKRNSYCFCGQVSVRANIAWQT